MYIKCWGSRGSIPVSGKEYLVYGGDTTCMEIRSKRDKIIIVDAGSGLRRLGNELMRQRRYRYDFIFTHAHWDHLMGFPFFKPLYTKRAKIRMQGCPFARQYVEKLISRVMAPPNFPIKPSDIIATVEYEAACQTAFFIDTIEITPIAINHPNGGSGYKFTEDGKSFVFLTDNELDYQHRGGLSIEEYTEFCRDADLLIHDAEFTPEEYKKMTKGWGHTVYPSAVNMAADAGVKSLGLFHINQDRSDNQVEAMVKDSKRILKKRGADTECFAVARDMEFEL